jgi:hypothetical protein
MTTENVLTTAIKCSGSIPDGLRLFIKTCTDNISGEDCSFIWDLEQSHRIIIETEKDIHFTAQIFHKAFAGKRGFPGAVTVSSHDEGIAKVNAQYDFQVSAENRGFLAERVSKANIETLFNGAEGMVDVEPKKYAAAYIYRCDACGGEGTHTCGNCNGRGHTPCGRCNWAGKVQCTHCNGRGGYVSEANNSRNWVNCVYCYYGRVDCPDCGGRRRISCRRCGGGGKTNCGKCEATGLLTCVYWTTQCAKFTTNQIKPTPSWFEPAYLDWMRRGSPSFPSMPDLDRKEKISISQAAAESGCNWRISYVHDLATGVVAGKFRDLKIDACAIITDAAHTFVTPIADIFIVKYAVEIKRKEKPKDLVATFDKNNFVTDLVAAIRQGKKPGDFVQANMLGLISGSAANQFAQAVCEVDGRYLMEGVIDIAGASFLPIFVILNILAFCDIPFQIQEMFGPSYTNLGHFVPILCLSVTAAVAALRLRMHLKKSFDNRPYIANKAFFGIGAFTALLGLACFIVSVNAARWELPNRHLKPSVSQATRQPWNFR